MLIEWEVENENEVKDYGVEYSTDGIHFSTIGVISSGNPAGNYSFVHVHPEARIGFYRIRIDKLNGESEYKRVIKVTMRGFIAGIHIYPNPFRQGIIDLRFVNQPLGKYRFNLYNILGQKMFSEELNYSGEAALALKGMKNFSAGIYQLEIIKPTGERTLLKMKAE